MVVTASSILESIDKNTLAPVVSLALRRDSVQIQDWTVTQLGGGMGNPVSVGLYRFEGLGQDGGERLPWSVVLKIIQSPANVGWTDMGEGEDAGHWNYWKRELFLYQSGLLEALPEGLAAPRFFSGNELPGNFACLWLEDIREIPEGAATLERYVRTARQLGRLNGSFAAGQTLPSRPWLGRNLIQQWIASFGPLARTLPWEHPLVLRRYPRPEQNAFRRMLFELERFQPRLAILPQTLCHGDTYPTNFKSRLLPGGAEQTVALDWALAGRGRLGEDLGQFVFGALNELRDLPSEDITEALFEGYLAGVREAGARVDPRLLRFGFAALAALRVGLFQVYLLGEELKQGGGSAGGSVEPAPAPDCFEVIMAEEAYRMLE